MINTEPLSQSYSVPSQNSIRKPPNNGIFDAERLQNFNYQVVKQYQFIQKPLFFHTTYKYRYW